MTYRLEEKKVAEETEVEDQGVLEEDDSGWEVDNFYRERISIKALMRARLEVFMANLPGVEWYRRRANNRRYVDICLKLGDVFVALHFAEVNGVEISRNKLGMAGDVAAQDYLQSLKVGNEQVSYLRDAMRAFVILRDRDRMTDFTHSVINAGAPQKTLQILYDIQKRTGV